MKCFIAMAFSHEDTNKIYEKVIVPMLLAKGIEPVRVDKLVHNDNINDRIIEEIRIADFAIADLTYARPSVYYEAGFAERSIPVIYTIRRDHLNPMPNDVSGLHKLHFDLSMKNIVDWMSENDTIFINRLSAMIDLITEPIKTDYLIRKKQAEKSSIFSNLPVAKREQRITELSNQIFKNYEFTLGEEIEKIYGNKVGLLFLNRFKSFFSVKNDIYKYVHFDILTDIEKEPSIYMREPPDYNLNIFNGLHKITGIEEHWIICSFHKISFQTLSHKHSTFTPDSKTQTLFEKRSLKIPQLSKGFTGEVFLNNQNISSNFFAKSNYMDGFLTKAPPVGTQFVRGDIHKEYQFVYRMYLSRPVNRIIKIHLIDNISSEEELIEKLNLILSTDSSFLAFLQS